MPFGRDEVVPIDVHARAGGRGVDRLGPQARRSTPNARALRRTRNTADGQSPVRRVHSVSYVADSLMSPVCLRRLLASPRRRVIGAVVVVLRLALGLEDAVSVEVRRVLHIVLRHAQEGLALLWIDALDDAGGNHALLAEDPESRVDDEIAAA